MAAHNVWLAKYDSSDIVLADEVAGVSRDYNGNITVHMSGVRGTAITLVSPGPEGGPPTPEDFHRRLLRLVTGLAKMNEPTLIRPVNDEPSGWQWITEPL
jgi:hypothetical protein